jgi:hypothetical protein
MCIMRCGSRSLKPAVRLAVNGSRALLTEDQAGVCFYREGFDRSSEALA